MAQPTTDIIRSRALVISAEPADSPTDEGGGAQAQLVTVNVLDGPFAGRELVVVHRPFRHSLRDFSLRPGQRVVLSLQEDSHGGLLVHGMSIARTDYLAMLAVAMAAAALLFGQAKGIAALVALCLSGFIVIKLLIPAILMGYSPILAAVGCAALMVSSSLVIISGFTRKTFAAIVGTIGGTVTAGLLASQSVAVAGITGTVGEDVSLLITELGVSINYQGLFMAGVLIGAIGVVMDVAMSISSVVFELRLASPRISLGGLVSSGLRVGKDVMATMVNTLILAYAGASIPLFLVFAYSDLGLGWTQALNTEAVASEVIRALCGSIGLILTIPLTTATAALLASGTKVDRRRTARSKRRRGF